MKHLSAFLIVFISALPSFAQEQQWPRVVTAADGSKVSIYEPEPEYVSDDQFTGRAAISIKKKADAEPTFGAILFTATVRDRSSDRDIELQSFRITKMKMSGDDDETGLENISSAIEDDADKWKWGMSFTQLKSELEEEKNTAAGTGFNNAAPRIIYRDKPSTLIVLDGEPRVLYDKDLATDKVANSPNVIFKEKGTWNLYAGGNWYQSSTLTGGWKYNSNLSSKVRSVNDAIRKQEKETNDGQALSGTPKVTDIIVATEPTELIQTEGEPIYKNVAGTSLLYVANSPNEIFKDINTQRTYILVAGRWYNAKDLSGPWQYVPADKLPEDFAKIPEGSDKDAVLANVAGTDAAETAILDAAIPQIAKVDRRTATVNVEYDGRPLFNRIRGTSLSLAENANVTVIRDAEGYYFALDNGIWFISDDPYGPWSVANDRPRDIDDIPASSPAYYSRHVYVYDVMPDYVYMGYTPGYLGSYIYGPTVIYGTGYHYRPWFGRVYYPRPFTWGFGFMYDPWYGWNVNYGYNFGYLYVGFNWGRPYYYGYGGGWFGPYRHCPSYRRPYWAGSGYYGRGDYYGRRNNVYGSRPRRDYYGSTPNGNGRLYGRAGNNLYADQRGVTTPAVSRNTRVYRPGQNLGNNLNTARPANERYRNRILERNSAGEQPASTRPDNRGSVRPDGRDGQLQRPDPRRREMPTLTAPSDDRQSEDRPNRPSVDYRRTNDERRPSLDNRRDERAPEDRSVPDNRRVDRDFRPSLENRESQTRPSLENTRRPSFENRPSAPSRPSPENRPEQSRPSFESRPSAPSRPSFENRPSAPSRPSFENRPSAPSRPSFESRPSPAPRPSGGGGQPNNGGQSRRPDRR